MSGLGTVRKKESTVTMRLVQPLTVQRACFVIELTRQIIGVELVVWLARQMLTANREKFVTMKQVWELV